MTGRLAPGMDADLVVLDGDRATDPTAFARVRYTMRQGSVLYGSSCLVGCRVEHRLRSRRLTSSDSSVRTSPNRRK